jgi:hypothetical protein
MIYKDIKSNFQILNLSRKKQQQEHILYNRKTVETRHFYCFFLLDDLVSHIPDRFSSFSVEIIFRTGPIPPVLSRIFRERRIVPDTGSRPKYLTCNSSPTFKPNALG